mmetsp:Transcript_24275/g.81669  ORF Transcript_24275/g.81669 Transcript_24275/m.81669 type:complete len:378 (-) Transcript_24275:280-1413(-)
MATGVKGRARWVLLVAAMTMSAGLNVEPLSPDSLKEHVFDPGLPWLVVCLDSRKGGHKQHTLEVVGKAASTAPFPGDGKVGVLDCWAKLPSGKTAIDRLGLKETVQPIVFSVVAGKVTQATPEALSGLQKGSKKQPMPLFPMIDEHAKALAAFVAKVSEIQVSTIASDKDLGKCLKHKVCALVSTVRDASKKQKEVVELAAAKFRRVHFAYMNLGRYTTTLENDVMTRKPTAAEPGLALISKSGSGFEARPYSEGLMGAGLEDFIAGALAGEGETVQLSKAPTVKWRSKGDTTKQTRPEKTKVSKPATKESPQGAMSEKERAARERQRRQEMDEAMHSSLFEDTDDDDDHGDGDDHAEELDLDDAAGDSRSQDRDEL